MTASTPFTLTRSFDASPQAVWQAWSDAAALGRWWGPAGCTVDVLRFEFQPGGFFHYAMNFPGVPPMWGRFNYREIVPGQRLVWLNSFANEGGGIARAPFNDDCPLEVLNTVTLAPDGAGTRLSLVATPHGASAAEQAFFDALHPSLTEGYGGTLDQLATFLQDH